MQERPSRSHARRQLAKYFGPLLFAFAMPISGTTHAAETLAPLPAPKSIVVDREEFVSTARLKPNDVIRASDGRFIIAGAAATARAAATNAEGKFLWQYEEPPEDINTGSRTRRRYTSVFNGAVQLSNGNFLFCGSKQTRETDAANEITILNSAGELVERRAEIPGNDSRLTSSSFIRCSSFKNKILLIGGAFGQSRGYGWIVKLNGTGAKESEALVPFSAPVKDNANAEQGVVFVRPGPSDNEFIAVRINFDGEVVARRLRQGRFAVVLRPVESSSATSIVAYVDGGRGYLYSLSAHLEDIITPQDIGTAFDATQGCGYVLPDGSAALFGRTNYAAVGWFSASRKLSRIYQFDPTYASYATNVALPLSTDRFLTLRNATPTPNIGLVMSWLTIK